MVQKAGRTFEKEPLGPYVEMNKRPVEEAVEEPVEEEPLEEPIEEDESDDAVEEDANAEMVEDPIEQHERSDSFHLVLEDETDEEDIDADPWMFSYPPRRAPFPRKKPDQRRKEKIVAKCLLTYLMGIYFAN